VHLGWHAPATNKANQADLKTEEPVSKRFSLVKVKESGNIALTLHCVQPQEYIEYFED